MKRLAGQCLALQTCILHHTLVEKIALQGPALFTQIQLASCLWYDNTRPRGNLCGTLKTGGPGP